MIAPILLVCIELNPCPPPQCYLCRRSINNQWPGINLFTVTTVPTGSIVTVVTLMTANTGSSSSTFLPAVHGLAQNVITLTFRTLSLMIQKLLHQINLIRLIMLTISKLRIPSHQSMEETTKGVKQLRDQTCQSIRKKAARGITPMFLGKQM